MNIYSWIGIAIFAFFTLLPLKNANNLSKWDITGIIITMVTLFVIVGAIIFYNFNLWIGIVLLFILAILLDKKTYTKKRLIIYAGLFIVIGGVVYWLLGDLFGKTDSDIVLEHLIENPETTSLYFAKEGEVHISHNDEEVRLSGRGRESGSSYYY